MTAIACSAIACIQAKTLSFVKGHAMELSKAVGAALKEERESKGLTQEDFVGVSGRT